MDSLTSVLSVTVPIFGLIGLGYVAGRLKLIGIAGSVTLSEYVFAIALPALIFENIAKADFPPVSPWPLWLAYFIGVAIVWAIGMCEATLHGFTAAQSNTVLVGVPIILKAYGTAAAPPLFLLIAVHLPIMMTTATVMIEGCLDRRLALRQVAPLVRMLLVHPVVLALAVSAICRRFELIPTGQAAIFIESLGATAVPCALVGVGLGILRFGVRADFGAALFLSALKLVIHPALVCVGACHHRGSCSQTAPFSARIS